MAYSFDDAGAADRHTTQYFEMFCNRGIYHEGWTAVHPAHASPWVATEMPAFDDDVWELYGPDDWTQAHDLAAEQPEKLARAPAAVPDRGGEVQRAARSTTGASSGSTPTSPVGRSSSRATSQLLFGGMGRLSENSIVVHQEQVARGHGGGRRARGRRERRRSSRRAAPSAAGRSTRRTASRPTATTSSASQQFKVYGERADPGRRAPGADGVHLRRRRPRQGRRRHALRRRRAGRRGPRRRHRADGSSPPTRRPTSAATRATPVSDDYGSTRQRVHRHASRWVQIDLDEAAEDADHLITPEERLRVAMARQ